MGEGNSYHAILSALISSLSFSLKAILIHQEHFKYFKTPKG